MAPTDSQDEPTESAETDDEHRDASGEITTELGAELDDLLKNM
jgi:hypothetical protein